MIFEDEFVSSVFLVLTNLIRFSLEIMSFVEKLATVENVLVKDLDALKKCSHVGLLKFQIVNISEVK